MYKKCLTTLANRVFRKSLGAPFLSLQGFRVNTIHLHSLASNETLMFHWAIVVLLNSKLSVINNKILVFIIGLPHLIPTAFYILSKDTCVAVLTSHALWFQ